MSFDFDTFSPLQFIEDSINTCKNAASPIILKSSLFTLILSLEYAIVRYRKVANEWKTELPWLVSPQEMERWNDKFTDYAWNYHNLDIPWSLLEPNEKHIEKLNLDLEDLKEKTHFMYAPIYTIDQLEQRLIDSICKDNNSYSYAKTYMRKHGDEVNAIFMNLKELPYREFLEYQFEELSKCLDVMRQNIFAPSNDAISDVFSAFEGRFLETNMEKTIYDEYNNLYDSFNDKSEFLKEAKKRLKHLQDEAVGLGIDDWDAFFVDIDTDIQQNETEISKFLAKHYLSLTDPIDPMEPDNRLFILIYRRLYLTWQIERCLEKFPKLEEEWNGSYKKGTDIIKKKSKQMNIPAYIHKKEFASFIIDIYHADQIISRIRSIAATKSKPKDKLMPLRAAIDAGVIRRPTDKEFKTAFPDISVSKSSLSDYTNPNKTPYCDSAFSNLVEEFKQYK